VDAARLNIIQTPGRRAARLIHPTMTVPRRVDKRSASTGSGRRGEAPVDAARVNIIQTQEAGTSMSNYRRVLIPGGTYFFTLVTWHRQPLLAGEERVGHLREAFRHVKGQRPFTIDAIAILPDHLHCVVTLPPGDADYPGRWREIKKRFSAQVDTSTNRRNERPVWQRRYYEHAIRDEADWRRHLDYLFYNPVKHGLTGRVADWPWSSFLRAVERGWYPADWGTQAPGDLQGVECE